MANPTISQIKIGSTTYDICDFEVRSLDVTQCYKINRTSPSITKNGQGTISVTWNAISAITNKYYIGYIDYNTDNDQTYPVSLFATGMTLCYYTSGNITLTPTATQLWYDLVTSY